MNRQAAAAHPFERSCVFHKRLRRATTGVSHVIEGNVAELARDGRRELRAGERNLRARGQGTGRSNPRGACFSRAFRAVGRWRQDCLLVIPWWFDESQSWPPIEGSQRLNV